MVAGILVPLIQGLLTLLQMTNMDEKTFGSTPAAMYLVRTLNEIGNQSLSRSVGRRITTTSNAVNDLVYSYSLGFLTSKTVANCLRLMREEVTKDEDSVFWMDLDLRSKKQSLYLLVDKLRRNVQIGAIKRGIRLCQVARKAEKRMESPYGCDNEGRKYFIDGQSGKCFQAGMILDGGRTVAIRKFSVDEVSDVSPELLVERSNKRCKRLGKPHAKDYV